MCLFADDSTIYREIRSRENFGQLDAWAVTWLMIFKPSKCFDMKISQRKTSQFLYTIKGSPLETVTSHIYLGVEIDDKMTWTLHCTKVKKKASQALVRRTQPRL